MISSTADHAIRALLVLARTGGFVRAEAIASATGAPRNYMAKTLNALAKSGIVSSTRGPAGGFALAVAPETLTLDRIVELFDVPRQQTRCLLGNTPCDPRRPCAAHDGWVAVMHAHRSPLASTTIADLLAGRTDHLAHSIRQSHTPSRRPRSSSHPALPLTRG
jgi:Rrf2 family protein